MIRDNLKAAITSSGFIVKEIAKISGVNKRTIDKWVGIEATEPKVKDIYKVCKVLGITVEYLISGVPPEGISLETLSLARKINGLNEKDKRTMITLLNSLSEEDKPVITPR
ncbi:MAG: helix-turn-helix domain-containing protein [Treponema sp.]|jgi:transcriptional regulator with XRE-family HTH domain|nr:helix-turn-helix domain-containing protein [Treponema sp.]